MKRRNFIDRVLSILVEHDPLHLNLHPNDSDERMLEIYESVAFDIDQIVFTDRKGVKYAVEVVLGDVTDDAAIKLLSERINDLF